MIAIPAIYEGVSFRSRLEARWAVFYDALEVPWLYEYEGFQLPSGWYLPDFWLPVQKCWIEIKGAEPTKIEERLCAELAQAHGCDVYCFFGDILAPNGMYVSGASGRLFTGFDGTEMQGDDTQWWAECTVCQKPLIKFEGRLDCSHAKYGFASKRIVDAYEAAAKARFW